MGALGRYAIRASLLVFLAILLSATLVRFAPGSGTDPRELDPRLSEESLRVLREEGAARNSLPVFYLSYVRGLFRGDLGYSTAFERPVTRLFAERIPVTFRLLCLGLAGGWLPALGLAMLVGVARKGAVENTGTVLAGALLAVPAAVMALVFLLLDGAAPAALAMIVFPRVYRQAFDLLKAAAGLPHVLAARARGAGPLRLFFFHTMPVAGPALAALAGVSVTVGFGASIPVEVICDSPGIGQLAWQAALGRDLPVLVNITLLLALLTLAARTLADSVRVPAAKGAA